MTLPSPETPRSAGPPAAEAPPAPGAEPAAPQAPASPAPPRDDTSALLEEPAIPAAPAAVGPPPAAPVQAPAGLAPAGPAPSPAGFAPAAPAPGVYPPAAPPAPQGVFMTPPPQAAPAPPPQAPGQFPTGPIPTGVLPAPPRRPSKAGAVTLAIALAVVALVAGTFAYLYTQAADEAEARAAEIEDLLAAQEDLEAENGALVSDLAGLQLTADDYEACQTAFDAYNSLEFEGDIDPDAENLEDLFTDEYIAYQNELAELYQEVVVKCSP